MFPIPTPLLRLLGAALMAAALAACGGGRSDSDPDSTSVAKPVVPAEPARGCSVKTTNMHCAP